MADCSEFLRRRSRSLWLALAESDWTAVSKRNMNEGMTVRPKLPTSIRKDVLFAHDLMCCVCPAEGGQIHHIDGDPSNNEIGNLALLCLHHHDLATRTGGLSIKLDPATVRKYRSDHLYRVELRRQRRYEGSIAKTPKVDRSVANKREDTLTALAIHEVRRIAFDLESEWKDEIRKIRSFNRFVGYDNTVRLEIALALDTLTHRTRLSMSPEAAYEFQNVFTNIMPIHSLVSKQHREPTPSDIEVLTACAHAALNLAYDGSKYLKNLRVVEAGTTVLWSIVRFATWNELPKLAAIANEQFETAIQGAQDAGFTDGERWLKYKMAEAGALSHDKEPPCPMDLLDKATGMDSGEN